MKKYHVFSILSGFAPPVLIGTLAWLMTSTQSKVIFQSINQPPLTPPPWVFIVVWTILYLLMGYANYKILTSHAFHDELQYASIVFYTGLLLNYLWPIVFFNLELFGLAVLILFLLLCIILINIIVFYRINKLAGLALVPYFLWLLFALYLNISIVLMN